MSTSREALHNLVDVLSDADVDAARRVLEGLVMSSNDELTHEDERAIESSRQALASGAGVAGEQVSARLRARFG